MFRFTHRAVRSILAIILFFCSTALHAGGFLAGTLVKVPGGYRPIELVAPGDKVCSLSGKGELVEATVASNAKSLSQRCKILVIGGADLVALPSQIFYRPLGLADSPALRGVACQLREVKPHAWAAAATIDLRQLLIGQHGRLAHVEEAELLDLADAGVELPFYTLALADHHHYFVTTSDILVHNAVAVVIPIFTWVIGEGIAFAPLASILAGIAATFIANKAEDFLHERGVTDVVLTYRGAAPRGGQSSSDGASEGVLAGRGPGHKRVYSPADVGDYHQLQRTGKSAGFATHEEGQRYLDSSRPISMSSKRRIAVIERGTYAVYSWTRDVPLPDGGSYELYHGYKSDWDGLGDELRRKFEETGLTNGKGKPK